MWLDNACDRVTLLKKRCTGTEIEKLFIYWNDFKVVNVADENGVKMLYE